MRSVWLVLRVLGRALKDYVRFIVMSAQVTGRSDRTAIDRGVSSDSSQLLAKRSSIG